MSVSKKINNYIDNIKNNNGNIGVFSVGHYVYWPQFPDLKQRLLKHFEYFIEKLKRDTTADIIEYKNICDCYRNAISAGTFFSTKQLDLIICFITTYTPSSNAISVIQKIGSVPILLVCMQPEKSFDYEKVTTEIVLENVSITSLPEITNALNRINKKPLECIVGMLYDDKKAWNKIKNWCVIACVAHKLRHDHIGLMGHVYEGMLDMNSDPTMFDAYFGMHIEHIEMEDLERFIDEVTIEEKNEKIDEIKKIFDLPDPGIDPITKKVETRDLEWPAKVSVGMDKLVYNFKLTGLAYYYRSLNNSKFERMHAGMIIGNSILTSKGIAIAGELDLKNCIVMLIMDRFGAGGSFAEFYPIDFNQDFVLVGHDGPHHLTISDGKPVLRKLNIFHGKRGLGPSVEYKIKTGPVSMLGLTQTFYGKFKMIIAEGESLPGTIPATGNTCTRVKFKPDVRTFLEKWSIEGPTHHFALGVGHISNKIEMLAKYLNIESVIVTL